MGRTLLVCLMIIIILCFTQLTTKSAVSGFASTPEPFLYWPFEAKAEIEVYQGFKYDKKARGFYGQDGNFGVVLSAKEGTKVYAPCDGWAIQSFQTELLIDPKTGTAKLHNKKKTIGVGQGHIVQIWIPKLNINVSLSNLSEVDKKIPYIDPIPEGGLYLLPEQFMHPEQGPYLKVKAGDLIGKVGKSGRGIGVIETPSAKLSGDNYFGKHGVRIEVYRWREQKTKQQMSYYKDLRLDPFGCYTFVGDRGAYEQVKKPRSDYPEFTQCSESLWLTKTETITYTYIVPKK